MSQWEGTYWYVLLLLGILKYRREVIDVLAEPEAVVARSMRRSGGLRHWKPHGWTLVRHKTHRSKTEYSNPPGGIKRSRV
ncbi:hypothetical protein M405DRAFT_241138 [Rhizopogon salebrosus TDB-379]|nr:hypothetical protein M405DRAFT_241138 [Rhizopogon salebrosus TDB-379]